MNGMDYIILGTEEYNKDFDMNDADKLIMSESKGNLIGLNYEEGDDNAEKDIIKAIKYQISTYKGQSGSPIFLRIKRMTEKLNMQTKSKNNYIYQFIGLHSRRGPMAGEQKFYESEKMNTLTENMLTNDLITNEHMPMMNLKQQKKQKNRRRKRKNNIRHQIRQ